MFNFSSLENVSIDRGFLHCHVTCLIDILLTIWRRLFGKQ